MTRPRPGEDSGLASLKRAQDPAVVDAAIRKILPSAAAAVLPPLHATQILRLRPGRRCVLRYDFRDPAGDAVPHRFVGKIRAKGPNRRSDGIAEALRQLGFCEGSSRRFTVAKPLGPIPELDMNLFHWYSGTPLQNCLADKDATPGILSEVGAALAELHEHGSMVDSVHSIAHEVAILERDLSVVADQCPSLARSISRVLDAARKSASTLGERLQRPIHRDFYPDQILVASDGLVLLDLDLYTMGDPILDVGNFVAHLREQALRETGSEESFREFEDAFVDGYFRVSRQANPEAVRAWIFLSFARHIYISWRIEARRPFVPAIVALCEREGRAFRSGGSLSPGV